MVGKPLLILFALTLLAGCAVKTHSVTPVAVECPSYPEPHPSLMRPVPTQYLLPTHLQRTAPKQP